MGFSYRRYGYVAGLAVALLANRTALSATATLVPSKDNTLYESDAGSFSNGRGQNFFVGLNDHGLKRRGVISFDLTATVPSGSTIQSANLRLHMSRTTGPALTISLHRCLAGWGEGDSVPPPGQEGGGTRAAQGDATWLHTFYDSTFWSTPGGDFTASASASLPVDGEGFYSWLSNESVVRDLQSWLDAPQTNHGWVLVADNESISHTAKRFDTRENVQADFRPVLQVVFTPPATDGGVDGGPTDAGSPDAGLSDGGGPDGGAVDAGPADSGQPGGMEPPAPARGCSVAGTGPSTPLGTCLLVIAAVLLVVWRRARPVLIDAADRRATRKPPADIPDGSSTGPGTSR